MPLGRGVAVTVWFSSSTASCASRHCRKPSAAVFMIRLAARGASLESAMLVAATTPRGFTGHEGLEDAGLAHMNGRVCDPALGRCLSADPFVLRPTTSRAEPQPRRLRVQQRARRARSGNREGRATITARAPPPISRWRWTGTSPQGGTARQAAAPGAGSLLRWFGRCRLARTLVRRVAASRKMPWVEACAGEAEERASPHVEASVRAGSPATGGACLGYRRARKARLGAGRRRRSMMRCFIEDRAGRSWHSDRMARCAT